MYDAQYEKRLQDLSDSVAQLERDYDQASRNLDGNLIAQIEAGRRLPAQFENDARAKRAFEYWNELKRKRAELGEYARLKALAAQGI